MRRFILSWFLVASLLLAIAFSAGVILTGPQLMLAVWGYYGSGVLQVTGQNAVEAFETGGARALDAYERRISPDGRMTLFLLDENGMELNGKSVPPVARNLAEQARRDGETVVRPNGRGVFEAIPAHGREGRSYRAVVSTSSRRQGFTWNLAGWALRIALVLLLAMALCSWLAWRLSAPVVRLRSAAREFASGNLNARADAPSFPVRPPEFRELAGDFDDMAARIQALVTSQGQLMRDVSHELRTPLTRLSLAVNLARGPEVERPRALDRIEEEVERLNSLIDRILRLARIESLGETARAEPIALADFVEGIVADVQFEAEAYSRAVTLQTCQACQMRGNRELLREAIENVMRNAVRYTREGSTVLVDAKLQGAVYRIVIRDHGPGVAAEHVASIFEAFHRAPNATGAGFGLGLAIAKRSVTLHNGSLNARNHPEGGLEVEIRIPVEPA